MMSLNTGDGGVKYRWNVSLFWRHWHRLSESNALPAVWTSLSSAKQTRKISHHISSTSPRPLLWWSQLGVWRWWWYDLKKGGGGSGPVELRSTVTSCKFSTQTTVLSLINTAPNHWCRSLTLLIFQLSMSFLISWPKSEKSWFPLFLLILRPT